MYEESRIEVRVSRGVEKVVDYERDILLGGVFLFLRVEEIRGVFREIE
jgi:hypothetical protein